MAVTHLAGDRVVIGQYAIQRCMLCGEVLDEFNARNMASPDGGTPERSAKLRLERCDRGERS